LLIFFVALISRHVVNNIYDVNVFKDYMSGISLIYYGSMALFSVVVYNFPKISFKDFGLKLIIKSLTKFLFKYGFKVLVILLVGLAYRCVFNGLYDVNTFKDFKNIIYLTDCGLMSLFSIYINNLPEININNLNIKVIREAIKGVSELNFKSTANVGGNGIPGGAQGGGSVNAQPAAQAGGSVNTQPAAQTGGPVNPQASAQPQVSTGNPQGVTQAQG
jgi:hypothetical protein